MIKPSVVYILLAICILMAASFYMVKGDRPEVSNPPLSGKLIKDLNTTGINSIEIKKGDVAIKLEKKDKDWLITSHKDRHAKLDRVEELLNDIKGASIEGTRMGSATLFDLDEKKRTEVVMTAETGKTSVFLGKSPDYSKAFVQIEANGKIYEVDKGLDNSAGIRTEKDERILDPAHFYDLKVFNMTSDDIIDISIKKENEALRVQRIITGKGPVRPKQESGKDDAKPIWGITEPEIIAADENSVNSICSTLADLNAKGYADTVPEKDRGLDKPVATLKVLLKDGSEFTLNFGKIDGDEAILSVSGKSDPYKIYKYLYDSMTKGIADLKKKDEKKDVGALPPGEFNPSSEANPIIAPNATPLRVTDTVPPLPPVNIETEAKPVLPPAVVRQPEPQIKTEEKK